MHIQNKKEALILFFGDIVSFLFSLWIALFLRNSEPLTTDIYLYNLLPFSIIFVLWIVSFFIAGLYEKQKISRIKKLPELILKTQALNSVIAIVFFYFVPFFGVTPKTILFIYILISLFFTFAWRVFAPRLFSVKSKENAILIGRSKDAEDLKREINADPRYSFSIIYSIDTGVLDEIDFNKDILERIYEDDISVIIVDSRDHKVAPILQNLYNLIFSKVQFVDLYKLYEEVFDRVPVTILQYSWFLENVARGPHKFYDFLKRATDIVISSALVLPSLIFYPFVYILIKLDDGGTIFIKQQRIGKNNKQINILKFRTMNRNDQGLYEKNGTQIENKVTRVGQFLRNSRIDELPQLFNVFAGDTSLIGPRPELPHIAEEYSKNIPYYSIRHIIKPGLSGWAQMYHENHPHHGIDVAETKNKLSYDLFYIKNRSFVLDIIIALKTVKILLSRQGK